MKKEVVIAILAGFILGLVITFGIYRAQKSLNQNTTTQEAASNLPEVAPTPEHQLTITQPINNVVTDKEAITVSGITSPYALISITSEENQTATQADEVGNFSTTLELFAGANTIVISAYTENGGRVQEERTVVFSTAFSDTLEDESTSKE